MRRAAVRKSLAIQHLRGLAALAVLTYHAGQWIRSGVEVGAAGVDVFFVISGFVMWTSTWGREVTPLDFLRRRAIRVVPLYWLATLAVICGAVLAPALFYDVTLAPGHIVQSMLFIPHLNPQGGPFPVLAPGWTLTYEAAFYLAFAAALLMPAERRLGVLAAILTPLACLGYLWPDAYRLLANPMLMQFLAGVLVARLWLMRAMPGAAAGAAMISAALALFWFSHVVGVRIEQLQRPFYWGGGALLLVTGTLCLEAAGRLPHWPWLRRLGDASYALYLVHVPVLILFNRVIGPTHPALFFGLAMALCIAAGLAVHAWIERPLLDRLRRPPGAPAIPAGAPGHQATRSGI